MTKRKYCDDENAVPGSTLPLPIQTFLWRQTSPFIRPKLGKLHEATCIFCQQAPGHHEMKEACKSFEKVLVQNILFGLSPSLTEAIRSIPRWRLVQAALPHVMHCCAAMLYNRRDNIGRLGSGETKLLYTLHWILLDAAEECADSEPIRNQLHTLSPFQYHFSVTTIEVFVYLFAPLCFYLKESDFQSFRLENGLKIWQAMWEYRQPGVPCFTAHVKPRRQILRGRRSAKNATQFGDVFLGGKKSAGFDTMSLGFGGGLESPALCSVPPSLDIPSGSSRDEHQVDGIARDETLGQTHEDNQSQSAVTCVFDYPVESSVESSKLDTKRPQMERAPSGHSGELCKMSSSDTSTSAHIEIVCEICHVVLYNKQGEACGSCKCDKSMTHGQTSYPPKSISPTDKDFAREKLDSSLQIEEAQISSKRDVTMATYMDVAVLRCLFITQWLEEGVFWGLQYLLHKLQEIYDDPTVEELSRQRSNSLPIPKIEVSLCQSPENKAKEPPPTPSKEPPQTTTAPQHVTDSPYLPRAHMGDDHHRRSGEKSKHKKMKMADLKAFVDSKLRSRSEKRLESIEPLLFRVPGLELSLFWGFPGAGTLSPSPSVKALASGPSMSALPTGTAAPSSVMSTTKDDSAISSEDQEVALYTGGSLKEMERELPRPGSALGNFAEQKSDPECLSRFPLCTEMVRGESMPSLRHIEDSKVPDPIRRGSKSVREKAPHRLTHTSIPPNPIITVTEHTPTPSPEMFVKEEQREPPHEEMNICPKFTSMTRSLTDSNIKYTQEEILEASGAINYISKEGGINNLVVLKAVHCVTLRDSICTLRVCEVVLNLLDTLLDMDLLKNPDKEDQDDSDPDKSEEKLAPLRKDELSVHNMFMNSIVRVFKNLGCPHGCGDGHRGPPADFLRSQALNTLKRLLNIDASQFRQFLKELVMRRSLTDIMDFFHAFVGFCVDPSSLLSPLGQKRTGARVSDTSSQGGYATNFGAGAGGVGAKGIEGQVMACIFKVLITRLEKSLKELRNPENMGLYCDVRQLMTYTREAHGSIFRRVALSGLLDSADRPHKKGKQMKTQTAKICRRNTSADPEDHGDSPYSPTMFIVDETSSEKASSRKSLFRKKGMVKKTPSSQSIFDEREDLCPGPLPGQSPAGSLLRQQRAVTPRLSLSEDEGLSALSTPTVGMRRKISRFPIVNWLKGDKIKHESSHEEDSGDSPSHDGAERLTRRASQLLRGQRLQKGGGHMGLTLMRARKRMEDHLYKFGFGRSKNKHGSFEEPLDLSRRNSLDFEMGSRETEMVIIKERKIVSIDAVRNGMLRFSFLLETCQPGSIPDPPLIAATLDLQAPVVARAALLLECAYFIHRCNKGQWPTWMKLNLPMFRLSGPLSNRGTPSGMRRTHILQRAAGRMFYQWGETIGSHLEELLESENLQLSDVLSDVTDDVKKRQLRISDEEEDFLDEASVNPSGNSCPFALKMVAVHVLLEITSFLRETHQYLPKTSRHSQRERPNPERGPVNIPTNRRWSMGLSTMWFSQTSAQSLVSIADQGHPGGIPGERRISFVLHEADAESVNSSNTTLTMQEDAFTDEKKGRRLAQGRAHLLRRGGATSAAAHNASFKRRSFKLRRASGKMKDRVDEDDPTLKRSDSIKSKRKVSAVSDRSDTSEHADASGEESPGILSDEQAPDSPNEVTESDDSTLVRNMPWLKVVVKLSNSFNYICTHQQFCHPNCYRRQMRACSRLIKGVRKVYGDDFGYEQHQEEIKSKLCGKDEKKDKKMTRKTSNQLASGSPVRRKESVGRNLDKIDRNVEIGLLGTIRSRPGSMVHLARDIIEHSLTNKYAEEKSDGKRKFKLYDVPPVLKYLKTQVQNLFHSSLSLLVKGAVILNEDMLIDILPVAWEILLESDQQLAGSAAVMFILSSVKAPDQAVKLMRRELQHEDAAQRINAILRFQALWRFRYQAWPRMEDNAHNNFKVPPPGIDFTLPSPKIGIDAFPVVDPPWMPHFKTKVEEVTLNQDRSRTFVTATKTRKKQQMELIQTALLAEEEKHRLERENFLITTVAVNMQAAYEPALYHAVEEHEDIDDDQSDQQPLRSTTHHIRVAQSLFPSCLCSAAVPIINLLDDAAVSPDGTAVYQVACQTIWNCLVEDPALFLRHFLEKLTRERQDEMIQILRRLIRFFPRLPPQAGFTLFNYLVGYVMFYVRTPAEGSQELIGSALSLLWLIVPSVQGILLKDLKQILRKEQCDTTLLITANVPSAKKVIVHGPDAGGIPSQFPVHEDTQFITILQESLEFFGIDEEEHEDWQLVDHKSNQIHNPNAYVRDFYFFKRSQYPQLTMIKLGSEESAAALQKQAFSTKFVETGKVLLMLSILRSSNQLAQRVFFLHEELQKLPSFPRKAMEAEFGLYDNMLGKCLLNLDVFHKLMWVKLVARMFEGMAGSFAHSSDIHLFINVLNGALILHCEDSVIMRMCCATFINAAFHFKNIFALNGYFLIVPTMLRIYSNHQTNALLCQSIEFLFNQFYILHRKPFILQMFGSVAPILDSDINNSVGDVNKVEAKALFKLLLTLERESSDPLDIMELVDVEKPLKALDFCYFSEPNTFPLLDAISLCVTVVAYAADSLRGHQMLTILEAILPFYLKHLQMQTNKSDTPGSSRAELLTIHQISICMKALINNSEALAKNYTGPQSTATNLRGSSIKNAQRTFTAAFDFDEEGHSRYVTDHNARKHYNEREIEDSEMVRSIFRKPRDALLHVVAEFLTKCTSRLVELNKRTGQENKVQDLLDTKCHLRLAEVAHSLLKVSPYDPITMACRGLQCYMIDILPMTDWAQEAVRPALIMIMRRLDKTFNKVYKKPAIRRNIDWEAAANLLKGVYQTLARHPYVAHLPHLKTLISVCQSIILGDAAVQLVEESISNITSSSAILNQAPPQHFSSVVVRLIAMQMLALGETYSLEQVCGGSSVFPNTEKAENILMDLILPLCLRTGSGRKDMPGIRQSDVSFALTVILSALNPPATKVVPVMFQSNKPDMRSSVCTTEKSPIKVKSSIFQIGFLGLKILIVCFESQLASDWHRIAQSIRELGSRHHGGLALWNFLDFVVTHRTPLYMLLMPFIQHKVLQMLCDNDQEYYYQQLIKEKLQGFSLPAPKCKGTLLVDLANEMKKLKEELCAKKPGDLDHRRSIDPHDNSNTGKKHRSSFAEFLSEVASGSNGSGSRQGPAAGLAPKLVSGMSMSSTGVTSRKSGLMRQWSVRSESQMQKSFSIRLKSGEGGRSAVDRFLRRTSIHEVEGCSSQELLQSNSPSASSEPRLVRRSTTLHTCKPNSKRNLQDSTTTVTSETPSSPQTPLSGHEEGTPTDPLRKHRLQRQMAQSRKTFRFRSSRKGNVEHSQVSHVDVENPDLKSSEPTLVEEDANGGTQQHLLALASRQMASSTKATLTTPTTTTTITVTNLTVIPTPSTSTEPPKCRIIDTSLPSTSGEVQVHLPRRRGAMIRSHSSSPGVDEKLLMVKQRKPAETEHYVTTAPMQQCDSVESLSNSENSALLKENEKIHSETSLYLAFEPCDEDTLL